MGHYLPWPCVGPGQTRINKVSLLLMASLKWDLGVSLASILFSKTKRLQTCLAARVNLRYLYQKALFHAFLNIFGRGKKLVKLPLYKANLKN